MQRTSSPRGGGGTRIFLGTYARSNFKEKGHVLKEKSRSLKSLKRGTFLLKTPWNLEKGYILILQYSCIISRRRHRKNLSCASWVKSRAGLHCRHCGGLWWGASTSHIHYTPTCAFSQPFIVCVVCQKLTMAQLRWLYYIRPFDLTF